VKQEMVSGNGISCTGPYASLHLAPDRQPCQHPTTLFFTGPMPFLPPNQQHQSTEGMTLRRRCIVKVDVDMQNSALTVLVGHS